jgi:hypothetical protein
MELQAREFGGECLRIVKDSKLRKQRRGRKLKNRESRVKIDHN